MGRKKEGEGWITKEENLGEAGNLGSRVRFRKPAESR